MAKARSANSRLLYYLVADGVLAEDDPRLRAPRLVVLGVCRDGESAGGWRAMAPGEEPEARKDPKAKVAGKVGPELLEKAG